MPFKDLATDVVKGAIAGAVATRAMEPALKFMYRREPEEVHEREQAIRDGFSSEVAVEKIAELAGEEIDEDAREKGGEALHWGLGIGAGVAYALARRRYPIVSAGQGAAFGTAFFLSVDEGLNTAAGFTPPFWEFPWQVHARGLAGHLAYGVTAETTLDALDFVMPPRNGG